MKSNPLTFNTLPNRPNFAELEVEVLDYWDSVQAFEKSVTLRPENKPYVFYDGPPFATGLPHYGHLLGSVMKDIVPRYWTMKGFRVERKWGWDCHGIPIENMIEKELNLKGGKRGIEELGIDKFNHACRSAILRFDKDWEVIIRRIGRWVDFKQSYKTMDTPYMESVWWAFKQLYDKQLAYEGKKVILYCPRCSSPLSNFEIAMDNSYKEVESPSTVYKYPIKGQANTFLLAWSTTPWNKIATTALVANPKLTYVKVQQGEETYILAKDTLKILNESPKYTKIESFPGSDLEGLEFELHYDFYPHREGKRAGVVVTDEYVTSDEGTGIVTLAVYGEDDFRVMQTHNIQLVEHVDEQGLLKSEVTPWAGMFMLKVNPLVNQDLANRGLIYRDEPRIHQVPVCYRCETRLYHAPLPAWFVDIQNLKQKLLDENQHINWVPAHLKEGRFKIGLETAPDWNISRSRYWGTPMPVWVDEETDLKRVVGSIAELQEWAVKPEEVKDLTDIHREYIDHVELYLDDKRTIKGKRIKEVFDCWVESGSMPFASEHYPFENKDRFTIRHPAQYICEYIAQTRAWFYTLHVMSVALFGNHTFQNALTTGTIMAADGTKMSKSKRNFTDPMLLVNKYGMDSLRLYFASSPLMKTAENVNFSEDAVDEIRKKVFNTFYNVFTFYKLYDDGVQSFSFPKSPKHVLDRWLISKVEALNKQVIEAMDQYDVVRSSRALMAFVSELSTWWLRLSRDRLRDSQTNPEVLQVFRATLLRWSLLMAPFAPFFTEIIYHNLVKDAKESIHHEDMSEATLSAIDLTLDQVMEELKSAVEKIHSVRKEAAIKVRQPLSSVTIHSSVPQPEAQVLELLAQETNVKQVNWVKADELAIKLDTNITPELEAEGGAREIIRQIQDARRQANTAMDEQVEVILPSWPTAFEEHIKTKVLATKLTKGVALEIVRHE